jgi:hypothetical protein
MEERSRFVYFPGKVTVLILRYGTGVAIQRNPEKV